MTYNSDAVQQPQNNPKKKIISIVALILIFAITVCMVGIFAYNGGKKAAKEELVAKSITPDIIMTVISSEINEISELACAEYVFTNSAQFSRTNKAFGPLDWLTKKSFVQKWDGVVKAGIKLENLSVEVTGNVITITMPHAEILSYEVDYDSVEILDENNNLFNPITVEDKAEFDKETKEETVKQAIDSGLLEKAETNAEGVLTTLLTSSLDGIDKYTIEFKYQEN